MSEGEPGREGREGRRARAETYSRLLAMLYEASCICTRTHDMNTTHRCTYRGAKQQCLRLRHMLQSTTLSRRTLPTCSPRLPCPSVSCARSLSDLSCKQSRPHMPQLGRQALRWIAGHEHHLQDPHSTTCWQLSSSVPVELAESVRLLHLKECGFST